MNATLKNRIQFIALILIGVLFIYLSVSKLSISELLMHIRRGNFWVAFPVFAISIFGYFIRSLRWQLIFKAMGYSISTVKLFSSLSIGYMVNFATPRLGEISRCLMLKKTNQIPIEQSIISVIAERVIDFICLIMLLLLTFWTSSGDVYQFIANQIMNPILNQLKQNLGMLMLIMVIGFVAFMLLLYFLHRNKSKLYSYLEKGINSVKDIFKIKAKLLFLIYTLIIWGCYFFMTYLWFNVFKETQELGFKEAFVLMTIGSIGRSVPIQGGGMGAYHYLVSNAFTMFGISLLTGNAMAFIIHGAQMILTITLGAVCWIGITMFKNKK